MAPGRKLGGGCWTCRLRRKRCDAVQPVCGSCQGLEIPCHSDEARPSWMDGGSGQRHMSESIKKSIKQNALLRRERRLVAHHQDIVITTAAADRVSPTDSDFASASSTRASESTNVSTVDSSLTRDPIAPSLSAGIVSATPLQSCVGESEAFPPLLSKPSSTYGFSNPIRVELGSVMIYLDYVFPFLFPFYQPSLLETGRQWLLGLLCQNEVSLHLAASLSAYFFSLVPQKDEHILEDDCKTLVRDRLLQQMDMALTSIQSTVSATSHRGRQSPLLDKVRIMEEITQLLVVEVTVRRNTDWTIHLTPALVLFDEIFQTHGSDKFEPSLAVLMSALPSPFPIAPVHHKPLPNTADQSALGFFMSLLLFIDIIASTCLGTPPVLQKYHRSLFSSHSEGKGRVSLEAIVGCQNWALIAIGNISALCAWKRDARQSGTFSVVRLVKLAEPISQTLEQGLTNLDFGSTDAQEKSRSTSLLEGYYSQHDGAIGDTSIANVTRIWAHAAKIYLSVGLSGWQENSTDTQPSVAKVLSLLQAIESPAQLRNLSWPICVAGCLASPHQERDFLRIIGKMGPLGEFGTLYNTLDIMKAVWNSRDTLDGNFWSVASFLSILGSPALLL